MNTPQGEETIFSAALRLSADERTGYLARSTEGNPELRQRLEALLANYDAANFLEQAAVSELRKTLIALPLTESAGDTIGRYKLLQQIGEGGCGVVYMAEQLEPVRRRVALKIIKLGMDTKSVIARFEAERQALALMDHPNIANVLRERNMLPEARSIAGHALALYDRHPDWPSEERQHASGILEAVLRDLGDPHEAAAVRLKQLAALRAAAAKDDLSALNNLAWIMATSTNSAIRDGRSAVQFAEGAVAKTGRKDPDMLDTLAAAYAETGDFAKATEAQREAIGLAHDESKKSAFTTRLKLFQSKSPCREP